MTNLASPPLPPLARLKQDKDAYLSLGPPQEVGESRDVRPSRSVDSTFVARTQRIRVSGATTCECALLAPEAWQRDYLGKQAVCEISVHSCFKINLRWRAKCRSEFGRRATGRYAGDCFVLRERSGVQSQLKLRDTASTATRRCNMRGTGCASRAVDT